MYTCCSLNCKDIFNYIKEQIQNNTNICNANLNKLYCTVLHKANIICITEMQKKSQSGVRFKEDYHSRKGGLILLYNSKLVPEIGSFTFFN